MKSIAAGGARLSRALLLGLEKTPAKLGKKGLELLDIHNLWTTALILVFWLAASVIGGPLGVAVNGGLDCAGACGNSGAGRRAGHRNQRRTGAVMDGDQ
jgi:hypothetical protein